MSLASRQKNLYLQLAAVFTSLKSHKYKLKKNFPCCDLNVRKSFKVYLLLKFILNIYLFIFMIDMLCLAYIKNFDFFVIHDLITIKK